VQLMSIFPEHIPHMVFQLKQKPGLVSLSSGAVMFHDRDSAASCSLSQIRGGTSHETQENGNHTNHQTATAKTK